MPFELVHEVAAPDMMPFTDDSPDARAVMALDIATKYQFHTPAGDLYHVARPLETLDHLLRITRIAFATVVWVTGEAKGFWAFNHSGPGMQPS